MKLVTEKDWNDTNHVVCLKMNANPPIAALALFVFGAVVEEEAQEHDSNLEEMGFDVEKMPLGLSVWEGTWEADPPDHEGITDSSHAVGTLRRPTEEELHDIIVSGSNPWTADLEGVREA
jgi:hypothetical protein